MVLAYVLINSEVGKDAELLKALKGIEGVKEVFSVYGVYDIIAKVEGKTVNELKETVITKIRQLNYVKSTLTMIVMENI
ncbi:MAG: Lrp/AsnC ligand binding domain-containing protein [Candidatus Bathyarchaeia archaeon]|nr:Lrp/AsnC ligand binding domain-containing protein [Candidatus Bathyarchaeota archaeon]